MALELGVSRAPVREALRVLGEQGMVSHQARVGCVVNGFTPKTVDDLYAVRAVLERWSSLEGVKRLTAEDLERLERYLIPLEAAWVRQDNEAFYTHAWMMREIILERAGNGVALAEIRKLRTRLHSLPLVLYEIPEHSEWSLERHRRLVAAAKRGDGEGVANIVGDILMQAGTLVRKVYEERIESGVATQQTLNPTMALSPTP